MDFRIVRVIITGLFGIGMILFVLSMMDLNYEETIANKEAFCEENNMVMDTCKIFNSYNCCFVKGDKLTEYPIVYDYETKTVSFGKVGSINGGK